MRLIDMMKKAMMQLQPALVMLLLMTLLIGVLYPIVVTSLGQLLFPGQANGSLIVKDNQVIGSSLIGQKFDHPKYFWGRLSATSPAYNSAASSVSNYGPISASLTDRVKARLEALKQADPNNAQPVPVDLVTASGSGLDPHISPAAAQYQVSRVARVRGLSEAQVQQLVERFTQDRTLGLLGEPRVNVLLLNLALDEVRQ